MKRFLYVFVFAVVWTFEALCVDYKVDQTGVYLKGYNSQELKDMFTDLAYEKYIDLPGNEYPRIFVRNLPSDFAELKDTTERNRFFMQILIPLILKVNDEVSEEREIVEALAYDFELNKDVDEADMYYIDLLASKYDVTTPFKDTRKYIKLLSVLKEKVDIVPPSVLIASAAIHTNWGTSRIAVLANNLFKQRVWYEEEGLTPIGDENDGYKYKIYDSLEESIRDYVLKLNSNVNYEAFRQKRAVLRKRDYELYGKRMDWAMVLDSKLNNYAGLLDYTLTFYKLYRVDTAVLEPTYQLEE